MAAVYSTRFLAVSTTSTETVTFEVPSGYVAIVRDIDVYIGAESGGLVQCYLASPQCVLLDTNSSSEGGVTSPWRGRQVLNAGDTLEALLITSTFCSLIASGYLLSA